jgi:hypothetical protein
MNEFFRNKICKPCLQNEALQSLVLLKGKTIPYFWTQQVSPNPGLF